MGCLLGVEIEQVELAPPFDLLNILFRKGFDLIVRVIHVGSNFYAQMCAHQTAHYYVLAVKVSRMAEEVSFVVGRRSFVIT